MNKENFKKYAELKRIEKETKAAISELMPEIVKEMSESGADKIKSDLGIFSIEKRKIWKYSAAVERAKQIMESIKTDEEATGKAQYEETLSLKFTSKKDE